ncbi:hypothetical protein ACS0TY_018118 [Phlomoides rotata]
MKSKILNLILRGNTSELSSLSSYAVIALYYASSTARTSSAKVSDWIVNLSAIDPDGIKQDVVGLSDQTLLNALTNEGHIMIHFSVI